MHVTDRGPVEAQAPLNGTQQQVESSMKVTRDKIIKEVKDTFQLALKMQLPEFMQAHVTPKQAALANLDARTSTFFNKMMNVVNLELQQYEANTWQFMGLIGMQCNDLKFRDKYVRGIAFPHVRELIETLGKIKADVVDQINAG